MLVDFVTEVPAVDSAPGLPIALLLFSLDRDCKSDEKYTGIKHDIYVRSHE